MDGDHYSTIGVDKDADDDEIRAAYRSKAQQVHPDKDGGDVDKFKALQHAYDVLSDPDRRYRYDKGEDVTKRTLTIEEKAIQALMQLFTQTLETANDHTDLTITIRSGVEVRINDLGTQKEKAEAYIEKMHHLQERVTYKGSGVDMFHSLTEQRVTGARDSIEKMMEEGKVLTRVLQLLDEYECEVEIITQPTAATYTGGTVWR